MYIILLLYISNYACTPFKKDLLFTYVLAYIFGLGSRSVRVMSFSWSIRFMSIKFLKACDVKFYINLHVTYVNRLIKSFCNMALSHVKTHSLLLDSIYIWSIQYSNKSYGKSKIWIIQKLYLSIASKIFCFYGCHQKQDYSINRT